MSDIFWLGLFPVGVAAIASLLLAWLRPKWSTRRTVLVAALPMPALGALICFFLFVSASLASEEKCGVDACGMAMMFATIGFGYAAAAAGLGSAAAVSVKRAIATR